MRDDENLDVFLQRLERFPDIQCIAIIILGEGFIPEMPAPVFDDASAYSKLKRTFSAVLRGFGIDARDTCWITREKLETVIINKFKKEQVHPLTHNSARNYPA
jgi:hypothetical protein